MDLKGNSLSGREPEGKNITKVVTGEVRRQKKNLGQQLAETFIGGDVKSVAGYVFLEVLVPAAKDMIADMFSQGIERILYGEAKSASRRTGSRPSGTSGYVSYNRVASSSTPPWNKPPEQARISRAAHNFDDIVLATRPEAEEVISTMFDILSTYEQVTVADLLEMVGLKSEHTDHNYGWRNLQGLSAVRVRNGYLLDLPRPESLK